MQDEKKYLVKKGPADPFRGDWYILEKEFTDHHQAIAFAAKLTLQNSEELKNSWEQFGYEYSVFELVGGIEKKIWEGYKYIISLRLGDKNLDTGLM